MSTHQHRHGKLCPSEVEDRANFMDASTCPLCNALCDGMNRNGSPCTVEAVIFRQMVESNDMVEAFDDAITRPWDVVSFMEWINARVSTTFDDLEMRVTMGVLERHRLSDRRKSGRRRWM